MNSLRDLVFTLSLAIAFVLLSLFSVIEYEGSEITSEQKDKSALVNATFQQVVGVFAVLEKMPLLRLLPANKLASDYKGTMGDILDPMQANTLNYSQKLAKNTSVSLSSPIATFKEDNIAVSLKDYWLLLKSKMVVKDWSQP